MKHTNIKPWLLTIMIFLALMLVIAGSGFVFQAARAGNLDQETQEPVQEETDFNRTISVSGRGSVALAPDRAYFVVGVQTESDSAAQAMTDNNERMQAVIQALVQANISEENLQTQAVNLFPQYQEPQPDSEQSQQVTGYIAQNTVQVQVEDIESVGTLMDAAIQAGGNTIHSVRFEVSDQTAALNQARELAWQDALAKAEQLADLAGAQLGAVLRVSESGAEFPRPAAREELAQGGSVPIQAGQQTMEVMLDVTWLLGSNGSLPDTGGDQPLIRISPESGAPGSIVDVIGSGFEPGASLDIGIGMAQSEYEIVESVAVDNTGTFEVEVTIPDRAEPGEEWVVVAVVGDGNREEQVVSNRFSVEAP